jgi:hypothetical protein
LIEKTLDEEVSVGHHVTLVRQYTHPDYKAVDTSFQSSRDSRARTAEITKTPSFKVLEKAALFVRCS